jgi:hypothetical protein
MIKTNQQKTTSKSMKAIELETLILNNYNGIIFKNAPRKRSFLHNPHAVLPDGIHFATIRELDSSEDIRSNHNKDNIYRLGIGIGKNHYRQLFGDIPERPEKGKIIDSDTDFTPIDTIMPHPIYAWMGWVAILNPSKRNLELVSHLLDKSYQHAVASYLSKME